MQLATVITLCRAFENAGLSFWIDGGWGVDALLEKQTRNHSDLDLAVPYGQLADFSRVLGSLGFARCQDADVRDWNPVYRHRFDGSVDLHGFIMNAAGEGVLGEPKDNSVYPAGALKGIGALDGTPLRCIAAEFVLQFRNGFEPRPVDHHDVARLCERFDLPHPSRFLEQPGGRA